MRIRNHPALLVLLASLYSGACSHSQMAKAPRDAAADEPEDEKVPLELWSPARKKANASYYFMAGEYEIMNRNLMAAAKHLETSYKLDPNPYVAAKMIEAQAVFDLDAALVAGKKTALLYPRNSDIQFLYGRLLTAKGEFKAAENALKQAVKLSPGEIDPYMFLVQIYETQGRFKEAIGSVQAMLAKNEDFAEGWAQLARFYVADKQRAKALEPARKAFNLASSDPEKVHLYASLLSVNGQRQKAASHYQLIIDLNVTQEEAIDQMIAVFKLLGSFEEAIADLKKTEAAAGKQTAGVRLQLAFVYWELKKYEDATTIFEALSAEYPQTERFDYMLALGQERINRLDKALATYLSFDASSEFYVPARSRSIEILRSQEKPDEALQIAREVIQSRVTHSIEFYPIAASILSSKKQFDEAISLLEEGFQSNSERVDLLFLKAVNQERAGKIESCIDTLKDVLKRDDQHSAAYNYLGYLYAERGIHLDEAERHIKKALELKPDDGYYLDSLGWVYYQKKDYKQALETLLKAHKKLEDEGTVLEHLGDTCEALDRPQEAVEWYEKATQVKMEDKDRERVIKKYEKSRKSLSS